MHTREKFIFKRLYSDYIYCQSHKCRNVFTGKVFEEINFSVWILHCLRRETKCNRMEEFSTKLHCYWLP